MNTLICKAKVKRKGNDEIVCEDAEEMLKGKGMRQVRPIVVVLKLIHSLNL